MKIITIPCNSDNYSYLIYDESEEKHARNCLIIDACEYDPINLALEQYSLNPLAILLSHAHSDHIGGLKKLKDKSPKLKVYAHKSLVVKNTEFEFGLSDNEEVKIEKFHFKTIYTPCHTMSDLSYYFQDKEEPPSLFTGDTLFVAGCGRFMEGDEKDMWTSLEKLRQLPPRTKIYCGHEYTISNLEFAALVEPNNQSITHKLSWAKEIIEQQQTTMPSTLEEELETNPFMRSNLEELAQGLENLSGSKPSPGIEALALARKLKNEI